MIRLINFINNEKLKGSAVTITPELADLFNQLEESNFINYTDESYEKICESNKGIISNLFSKIKDVFNKNKNEINKELEDTESSNKESSGKKNVKFEDLNKYLEEVKNSYEQAEIEDEDYNKTKEEIVNQLDKMISYYENRKQVLNGLNKQLEEVQKFVDMPESNVDENTYDQFYKSFGYITDKFNDFANCVSLRFINYNNSEIKGKLEEQNKKIKELDEQYNEVLNELNKLKKEDSKEIENKRREKLNAEKAITNAKQDKKNYINNKNISGTLPYFSNLVEFFTNEIYHNTVNDMCRTYNDTYQNITQKGGSTSDVDSVVVPDDTKVNTQTEETVEKIEGAISNSLVKQVAKDVNIDTQLLGQTFFKVADQCSKSNDKTRNTLKQLNSTKDSNAIVGMTLMVLGALATKGVEDRESVISKYCVKIANSIEHKKFNKAFKPKKNEETK